MNWEPVTQKDREIISGQLQRQPRNLHGVARRCPHQCPMVVINHPLPQTEGDAPFFPTIFWLTCPAAVEHISRMEDQGFIHQIQDQINDHHGLRSNLKDAHLEYIYLRRRLLGPKKMLELREQDKALALGMESLGIGGVADFRGIKCLHMHYAHYLVTSNNPVGSLVARMLKFHSDAWNCKACQKKCTYAGVAE